MWNVIYKYDFIVWNLSIIRKDDYNMREIVFQKKIQGKILTVYLYIYICVYICMLCVLVINAINVILKFEINGKIFNFDESLCKI